MKSIKIGFLILLCFVLVGCGNRTSEVEKIETVANEIEFLDLKEDEEALIVSINPKVALYYEIHTELITRIEGLNEDGVMMLGRFEKNDYIGIKSVDETVSAYVSMVFRTEGYAKDKEIQVECYSTQYQGEGDGPLLEKVEKLLQEDLSDYTNMTIVQEFQISKMGDIKTEEMQHKEKTEEKETIKNTQDEPDTSVCDVCGGTKKVVCSECQGTHESLCRDCNGLGYVIDGEICYYDGTPCRGCNDVGDIDDGKHGGERALCGECRAYAKSHKVGDPYDGAWGASGDFREYATSVKENKVACIRCNGKGKENGCGRCDNTGFEVCESCR